MKRFFALLLIVASCSPKVVQPDPESLKPLWLRSEPYQEGYYTGIGHSLKAGDNNYIQSAKKSALDDLVSQIKVTVSTTSILSTVEIDRKYQEQYEQTIQTKAVDEIQDFEMVDAWEDERSYWVYYRLSISRYRQIKEEQRRNATTQAVDFYKKGVQAEKEGARLQALRLYFQALKAMEKYLGEAIKVTIDGQEILLVNQTYSSIQSMLDRMSVQVTPKEIQLNRRVASSQQTVIASLSFMDSKITATGFPLFASFDKGSGDVFPTYETDAKGQARILLNKIGSKDLEQTLAVKLDVNALSGPSPTPMYEAVLQTLNVPRAQVNMKVQRPVVFITTEELSLGTARSTAQISNRLRNLLASNGFEFTTEKSKADLWFDIHSNSERGSVSGSIYITYLTALIKVSTIREGKEIYATTLDRIRGYGLDYDKSSVDAYAKSIEVLEKEKIQDLISSILQ